MKIMTVCGPIAPDDLGITMMHEHLSTDFRVWIPSRPDQPGYSHSNDPVALCNRGRLMRDPSYVLDNCWLPGPDEIIPEVNDYHLAGGGSIVEVSNIGLYVDPLALRRISEATGVHIIAGCGHYIEPSWPAGVREKSIDELANDIIHDLTYGIGETDVRAGIIGEVGSSRPATEAEERVIRAAARAHHATGATVSMHLPIGHEAWAAYRILHQEEGVPVDRIIMGHMDETPDPAYQKAIADLGVYIQFDTFGTEFYYGDRGQEPRDTERITWLTDLIAAGYTEQLLVSQDVFWKFLLKAYGGWGYDHILCNIVPRLNAAGVSDEDLHAILVDNPRRVLALPQ